MRNIVRHSKIKFQKILNQRNSCKIPQVFCCFKLISTICFGMYNRSINLQYLSGICDMGRVRLKNYIFHCLLNRKNLYLFYGSCNMPKISQLTFYERFIQED